MTAVALEGVHKSFGRLDVLRGIDLAVAFNLFPHMSVRENVMLAPRKVLRLSRQEADTHARKLLVRVEAGRL